MTNLIKIKETANGKAVSARELYNFLGYNSTQWKRWYDRNIVNSDFFLENTDYQTLDIVSNGNKTKDFALTILMAKELSMLARTEKGKEARQYFIECERIAIQKEASKLPETFAQALRLAAEQQEQIEKKDKIIEIQKEQKFVDQKLIDVLYDQSDRTDLIPKWRKY